ncbi:FtsX-like permease family protein [Streptococcus mutans OMZ175]|uniref:FtsX-like permease family protein n=1 Tax=Streptococcus mutans TaxID=1309 RepID=UPI0002B5A320|nr:FtsX-like permease family protein [Streptococcus mutans]EMC59732.1 putative ABC transporter permease [Streptococcus mutans OMZ175]QZS45078.1 FtsX-like permease family protein [Streptococcus mutans OMZ175]
MKKRIYWKTIYTALLQSKGRFISIMLLMFLGSFTFIGLKATKPNMQTLARNYLQTHKTADLFVTASSGFSNADQTELNNIKNAQIDFGQVTDMTLAGKDDAMRVFSKTQTLSTYHVESGRLPKKADEIALISTLKKSYKIGDTLTFQSSEKSLLKRRKFKVVGFINSSEIWSTLNLGSSTAGDGTLSSYALVTSSAFANKTNTLARIRYNTLKNRNPFSDDYSSKVSRYQDDLDKLLEDNGKNRLAELKEAPQAKVNQSKQALAAVKKQLQEKKAAINGLPAYQQERAQASLQEASQQLAQKEKQVQSAQAKIDAIVEPTYSTYTRSTMLGGEGYTVYNSNANSMGNLGNIFPIVLYAVAALVTFTTMTRFVDEERTNSGVFKALGYSNQDVIRKFLVYGFVASLIGTILGIFGGHYLLARIVAQIFTGKMTLGNLHLAFYWSYSLIAILLGLVSAVLPAYLIARRELSEKPAQLLLPKPPMRGGKIFLERLSFIWNHLSFTHKVTTRNIFRYKQRMLMTIFGVAGSVALLFAGLGIQSSLGTVIKEQFTQLTPYHLVVSKKDETENDQELTDFLKSKEVSSYQSLYYTHVMEEIPHIKDRQSVAIMVSDKKDFTDFVHLKNVDSGHSLTLPKEGVLISEKLARFYKVKAGDIFKFKDSKGKKRQVKVAAVVKMNAGHYLFMTKSAYQKIFAEKPDNNAYFINQKNDSVSHIKDTATKLLAMTGVASVTQNTAHMKTIKTIVTSLNAAMTVLVVITILLALVILYNLTNINIAERIRELSTIKVLGFYNREVTLYIYRETIVLSLVGIAFGLLAGRYLHQFIMEMIGSDNVMFGTTVAGTVYLIPVFFILLILLILGWLINRRLKNLDMLEALKSVD